MGPSIRSTPCGGAFTVEELWPGYCWVEVADGLPGLQSCKIHDGNNLRYLHLQENIEAAGWFIAKWQYEAEFNIPDYWDGVT